MPVAFVYLCTSYETSLNEWITKVSVLRIPGIHLFVDENLDCDLANLYSKGGFPNYLFINDNGECKPDAVTRLSANTDIKGILEMYNK